MFTRGALICALAVTLAPAASAQTPGQLGTHAWPNTWPDVTMPVKERGVTCNLQRWWFDNGHIDRVVCPAAKAAKAAKAKPKGPVA